MFKRIIALFVIVSLILSYDQPVFAQPVPQQVGNFNINDLPVPGKMVDVSAPFSPLSLKGIVVNPQKPLEFQFIVDTGNNSLPLRGEGKGGGNQELLKQESTQLVKYFLAGLTIPEGDLWVNLSPYEKNRMVPEALGQTELGRDLLAQDYILKQLTASLIYPEKDLGKEFWSRVYKKAQEQFGTTNVPVNTFNKVWILPDQAQVFQNGPAAYVTKSTLKVMLDEDYLALQKNQTPIWGQDSEAVPSGTDRRLSPSTLPSDVAMNVKASQGNNRSTNTLSSKIIRQIILPEIEKEVNTGKNFAPLRQIYQALILAKWYKQTIQNSLLDAVYTNKMKLAGVNLNDPTIKEQIYNRYLQAYKKGVFNYIKDEFPPIDGESKGGAAVPRKYFSGGTEMMIKDLETDGAMSAVRTDGAIALLKVIIKKVFKKSSPPVEKLQIEGQMIDLEYVKKVRSSLLTILAREKGDSGDGQVLIHSLFLMAQKNQSPSDFILELLAKKERYGKVVQGPLLKMEENPSIEEGFGYHFNKNWRMSVTQKAIIKFFVKGNFGSYTIGPMPKDSSDAAMKSAESQLSQKDLEKLNDLVSHIGNKVISASWKMEDLFSRKRVQGVYAAVRNSWPSPAHHLIDQVNLISERGFFQIDQEIMGQQMTALETYIDMFSNPGAKSQAQNFLEGWQKIDDQDKTPMMYQEFFIAQLVANTNMQESDYKELETLLAPIKKDIENLKEYLFSLPVSEDASVRRKESYKKELEGAIKQIEVERDLMTIPDGNEFFRGFDHYLGNNVSTIRGEISYIKNEEYGRINLTKLRSALTQLDGAMEDFFRFDPEHLTERIAIAKQFIGVYSTWPPEQQQKEGNADMYKISKFMTGGYLTPAVKESMSRYRVIVKQNITIINNALGQFEKELPEASIVSEKKDAAMTSFLKKKKAYVVPVVSFLVLSAMSILAQSETFKALRETKLYFSVASFPLFSTFGWGIWFVWFRDRKLYSVDPKERGEGIKWLATVGTKNDFEIIEKLVLSDPNPSVRVEAVRALWDFNDILGSKPKVESLLQVVVRDDQDLSVRQSANFVLHAIENNVPLYSESQIERKVRSLAQKRMLPGNGISVQYDQFNLQFSNQKLHIGLINATSLYKPEAKKDKVFASGSITTVAEFLKAASERGRKLENNYSWLKFKNPAGEDDFVIIADSAMSGVGEHKWNEGGIDLNQIGINRTGKTINVQFDPAQLNEFLQGDFQGFAPVITDFQYIKSPFPLLGINSAKEPEALAKA